jgi:hypothetical protein
MLRRPARLSSGSAALEQQIEKQKPVVVTATDAIVSTTKLAKVAAEKSVLSHSDQVGAKFQGVLCHLPRCTTF